ncbi:MAG TPA: HAD family hydrolase [Armatimonadota bacterium]|jgi:phosphoglycolate phosphatase-like HAD superfamily hydrolase
MSDCCARPYLPGTRIEVANPDLPRGPKPYALFDFDGTISLLREGWQEVMIPMMTGLLEGYALPGETPEQRHAIIHEFVTVLTGKQTIYQMIRFAEEIQARGGCPEEPLVYKQMYLDLLWERIKDRVNGLKAGELRAEDLVVPGALEMLEALHQRGVQIFIASGTDEPDVLDEAAALGVAHYAQGHIYGATDDLFNCSKAMVIERLIAENHLRGDQFIGCGDGFVEIEETKAVGGVAIGVATDEKHRGGLDEWKRTRLLGVGADIIIPDFAEHEVLFAYLWGED